MEFAADVAEAVASVRELATSAQDLAATAKEAQDGVAGITVPAQEAAAGVDEVAAAADKGAESLGLYVDAAGRARLANGQFATSAQAAAAGLGETSAATKAAGDAQEGAAAKADAAAAGGLSKYKLALVGIGVGAAVAVDAAGKFQDSTTHLVTDAGESAKNLSMVQQGILSVSAATGTSANDITNAMYHIESGGMHGASGLSVLQVAAQGAKVGGADLDTVSKTLVGTLNSYGMTSSNAATQTQMATQMMNQLITTVGAGDMRMQDLASSLSNVAPLAAAAHIQFAEVGGAIATMTAQGMSAQQATQDLSNTIRALSNPNNVAIKEMQQMGLSSQQVSQQLGQRGLTGTLSILSQAITSHMGPDGLVIQNTLNSAKVAAADAQTEIKAMPASLQALARSFLAGSVTSKQWKADLQALPPVQAALMGQFATTAEKANSFNDLLKAGSPAAQTYTGALAKVMGGATGLNTALMLTGGRMSTFVANTASVYNAGVTAGKSVQDWSTIQGTFNFKLDQAKVSLEDAGIALGTALLPAVTAVLGPLAHFLALVAGNKDASIALALVIGGILAGALGLKLASSLKGAAEGIKAVGEGAEWVIGKLVAMTAAQEAETAATEGATVAQTGLDVAMDANPIGLIIIAIVALIAVVVLVVTHLHFFANAFDIVRHAVAIAGHDIASAFDVVRHAVSTIGDDIVKPFEAAINWLKSNWKLILAILLDPIGSAVMEIKAHTHQISQTFDELRHDVAAIFDGWVHDMESSWDTIRHDAAAVADWIPQEIATKFDQARHDAAAAADGIVHDVASSWDTFRHDTAAVTDAVVSFFQQLPGKVIAQLAALPGQMLTIGENVIKGLINGIIAQAAAIPSIMGQLASDVASYFTDPLKLFSPSRLFFEHGVNIVQGAINGVKANAPQLLAAMRDLGTGVGAQGIGSAGVAGAIAPAGGSTTVHVPVQVTAQGMTPDYTSPQFTQYIQGVVQEGVLRYGQLNPGNGLTPAWGH